MIIASLGTMGAHVPWLEHIRVIARRIVLVRIVGTRNPSRRYRRCGRSCARIGRSLVGSRCGRRRRIGQCLISRCSGGRSIVSNLVLRPRLRGDNEDRNNTYAEDDRKTNGNDNSAGDS